MEKTAWDEASNSVLYSQTRMFLYWTYSFLPVLYFDAIKYNDIFLFPKHKKNVFPYIALLLFIVFAAQKGWILISQINEPGSDLYNPQACNLYRTAEIFDAEKQVKEKAVEADADVIVVSNHAAFTYIFDAMNDGDYTVYNITYDRRTWVYHLLQHSKPHRCLFVDFSDQSIIFKTVFLTDQSVVDYIRQEYGLYRNPYLAQ